jgi:hypothetical protein
VKAKILTLSLVTALAGCQTLPVDAPEPQGLYRPVNAPKPPPVVVVPDQPKAVTVAPKPAKKKVKRHVVR